MGFSRAWLMNGGDLSAKSSKGVDDSVVDVRRCCSTWWNTTANDDNNNDELGAASEEDPINLMVMRPSSHNDRACGPWWRWPKLISFLPSSMTSGCVLYGPAGSRQRASYMYLYIYGLVGVCQRLWNWWVFCLCEFLFSLFRWVRRPTWLQKHFTVPKSSDKSALAPRKGEFLRLSPSDKSNYTTSHNFERGLQSQWQRTEQFNIPPTVKN